MKRKISVGLAVAGLIGSLGLGGVAGANGEPPPPPQTGCSFPPGGAIAPLHSTAMPGGRDLVFTICSNSGRGESPAGISGSEFHGRTVWGFDVDPGGSQAKNRGGDS